MTQRTLIIANRLPVTVEKKKGRLLFHRSIGGLATVLKPIHERGESIWIGWPGAVFQGDAQIEKELLQEHRCHPVFLNQEEVEKFYYGICNNTFWPLFHSFPLITKFKTFEWEAYKKVNRLFCDRVLEVARATDTIWIHDYHLMLLPKYLRERLPDATIGFFFHVPFPPLEIFSLLPWDREVLEALLHADLIGFHTYGYARNFLNPVLGLFGIDNKLGEIIFKNRIVHVGAFPMGIDFERFDKVSKEKKQLAKELREKYGDKKIILSIARLDYTKGIPELLDAFELFLEKYPNEQGEVSLILGVAPSRIHVEEYRSLKKDIDEKVGRINGRFGRVDWNPIWYFYRTFSFDQLMDLYSIADAAVFPSLRDGLNLMAKEYVATRGEETGVLVVSEFAGVSKELVEAVIVNPRDKNGFADLLSKALNMPLEEQRKRIRAMRKRLKNYDARRWAEDFLSNLSEVKQCQHAFAMNVMSGETESELIERYKRAKHRLLFLDYDGTLVPFTEEPEEAAPSGELLSLLNRLCNENTVVLVSGRDKGTLYNWFGKLRINLVAEHGIWVKEHASEWKSEVSSSDWKDKIRPILELYTDRCPGSFIEDKDFSIAWHYRKSDPLLSTITANELNLELTHLTANMDVSILSGDKVIEIRPTGANKGKVALSWISRESWDFILGAGDDTTDEDLFGALPSNAYSIKVGLGGSKAKFNLGSPQKTVELLMKL
ncbi:MAG: bifunctional alpha,alpha-trehalose-phosphate synthase (UDP-forming)/trehalose-phosphatase [Methanobacteriota archaeon]